MYVSLEQAKRTTEATTTKKESAVIMQSSEELVQINSALTHCAQLKTQLQSTILHIRSLNSKYNQTDYMAVIRNLDNYQRRSLSSISPYPKQRRRDSSVDDDYEYDPCYDGNRSSHSTSTPVKRPNTFRRCQDNGRFTSTPKRLKLTQLADKFDCSQSDLDYTPKRSMRELKNESNTIFVRQIKLHREIEAVLTHIQVVSKDQLKRQKQELERSLYQSICSSPSFASPGSPAHFRCMQQSFGSGSKRSSFYTTANESIFNYTNYHTPKLNASRRLDADKRALERVQRSYATPLLRMQKRLTILNASLVSSC